VCQDKCLQEKNQWICGNTDHFTSFAVLLGGSAGGGGGDECGGSSTEGTSVIVWLSLAAILAAIIIVVSAITFYETFKRVSKKYTATKEKKRDSHVRSLMMSDRASGITSNDDM
jgi:hypothetical protein